MARTSEGIVIFEADEELRQMRAELSDLEHKSYLLREKLHETILRKMKEAGMMDRRGWDRRSQSERRQGDRRHGQEKS